MTKTSSDGLFLLIGIFLVILSMVFNYTAFASFSNIPWQQICFILTGLLYDAAKIKLAISTNRFWQEGHYILSFFQGSTFWILTGIAIIASYIFYTNMANTKSTDLLKESPAFLAAQNSIADTQSSLDNLVKYGSESLATTKSARLNEINEKMSELNNTPVKNYYGKVSGTFGGMNKCGIGQSRYNLYCPEMSALRSEKFQLNNWLSQNDSYRSTHAVLIERQRDFQAMDGNGMVKEASLEPFTSFSRFFDVPYSVALSVSMAFLSILSELLATLMFVSYSTVNMGTSPTNMNGMTSRVINKLKNGTNFGFNKKATDTPDAAGYDFSSSLNVQNDGSLNDSKMVVNGRSKIYSMTDTQYNELTKVIKLGICPPTLHSLRKRFGMNEKLVKTIQSQWLQEGLIIPYDRGGLTSYKLNTSS